MWRVVKRLALRCCDVGIHHDPCHSSLCELCCSAKGCMLAACNCWQQGIVVSWQEPSCMTHGAARYKTELLVQILYSGLQSISTHEIFSGWSCKLGSCKRSLPVSQSATQDKLLFHLFGIAQDLTTLFCWHFSISIALALSKTRRQLLSYRYTRMVDRIGIVQPCKCHVYRWYVM